MTQFLFVLSTVVAGSLLQFILDRYLSLYDTGPQVFLILTITHGFLFGPLVGEILGFCWGIISDASGIRMFGMNTFLLALAGYLAGKLRRRVASERITTQIIIALAATVYYAVGASSVFSIFSESPGHFSLLRFLLLAAYNGVFASILFYITDHWAALWRIPQEHV